MENIAGQRFSNNALDSEIGMLMPFVTKKFTAFNYQTLPCLIIQPCFKDVSLVMYMSNCVLALTQSKN